MAGESEQDDSVNAPSEVAAWLSEQMEVDSLEGSGPYLITVLF